MKIAVIGMGSIGQRHYANLRRLGYANVRGWDIDLSRGDSIDWSWKPDVVLVCTPTYRHLDSIFPALRYGVKGLFVEKPLAERWDSRLEVALSRSKESNTVTMASCNWRFRAGMKELLSHAAPLQVYARIPIPPERRTNKVFDIGIHFFDLALWKGDKSFLGTYNYAEAEDPYIVWLQCGNQRKVWHTPNRCNQMFLDEMRHFMHCVKTGEPTGNDFAQAAETLKLALGMRNG